MGGVLVGEGSAVAVKGLAAVGRAAVGTAVGRAAVWEGG